MPIEFLPVMPEYCQDTSENFEFFTLMPDFHEVPQLWNRNPKILDDGVVVFICQSGTGKLVIDMQTFTIQKGCFCLLLPYTVIQVLEYSEDIEITAMTGSIDFLKKLAVLQPVEDYASLIQENPCLMLTEKQMEEVKTIYFFTKERLTDRNRPLSIEIRDTLLMFMALEIVSLYAKHKPCEKKKLSRQEQIFRNFVFSIGKNFREHRTVEFYAEQACLTPRHFSTVIKNKSGKLPIQWITERTIVFIKFLLENSEMSIQEISNELNFPNPSFFSGYFKKHTGTTPKTFRGRKAE